MNEFESWWSAVKEDVIDNCENRMDEYDAKQWLEEAFKEGQYRGGLKTSSLVELVNELHRRMNE